ncbi:hypothetical protein NE237_000532 [Protea cynaroides]|uniref:Uncharacterized protein n=1 Tax=Protea cynaroides TaxID=273540 RepID=A0A9Q0KSG4_9MAGN|nr:hypothetical protein NE237_000532 [Protea cynaroides]
MIQEEQQHQKYNNSSSPGSCGGGGGAGRSSKKLKQKKIPQRGLGVAQLEKIRLEEQQKKEAAVGVSSPSFVLPLPPPHHHHHQQSSSSSSPFPASPTDLSSTNSLFKVPPRGPISTLDLLVPPPPPSFQTTSTIYGSSQGDAAGGCSGGRLADVITTFTGQGHFSSMWSNELNYNGDVPRLDHELSCRTQLQNEASYPIWHSPPPVVIDRKQSHSSTMVKVPSFTPSSSGLRFPMELPSNQSFCSNNNNYTPTPPPWPEGEKMVGIKRPWPFSLDKFPLAPSLSKIPSIIHPVYGPEEPSLYNNGNGSTFKFEPGNCIISQSTCSSTALPVNWRGTMSELNHKNGIKENGTLNEDFLTLGSPAISSSSMGSESTLQKPFLDSVASHHPIPEFQSHPTLASIEEPSIHNFFPAKGQISRVATTTNDHRRIEDGDTVDLSLKL